MPVLLHTAGTWGYSKNNLHRGNRVKYMSEILIQWTRLETVATWREWMVPDGRKKKIEAMRGQK